MTLNTLNAFLPILSIIVSVFIVIGGYVGFRSGYFRQSAEISAQTISALQAQIKSLESQGQSNKKEIARLRNILNTVRYALKRRGLHIEIEGEFVTLIDAEGQSSKSTQMSSAKIRPIKLTTIDDEDDVS